MRRTRARLALWSWLITFSLLLILGSLVYASVSASLAANARTELNVRATVLATRLSHGGPPFDASDHSFPIGTSFGGPTGGTYGILVAPDNSVIGPGEEALLGLPFAPGIAAARTGATDYREADLGGVPVRVLSGPVAYNGQVYVTQVLADRGPDDRTLAALLLVLAASGALGLTLLFGAGWLVASRSLIPIRAAMARQRSFAADASHELRTPLSIVRADLEQLHRRPDAPAARRDETVLEATAEIDRITRIMDSLLLLARADSGLSSLAHQPLDLAAVAAPVLERAQPDAAEHGIKLVPLLSLTPMTGDPDRLAQMIEVLLEAAITRAADGATLSLAINRQGHSACLAINVSQSDEPQYPDLEGDRLGTAVATWVAVAHGGTLRTTHAPDGSTQIEVKMASGAQGRPGPTADFSAGS